MVEKFIFVMLVDYALKRESIALSAFISIMTPK